MHKAGMRESPGARCTRTGQGRAGPPVKACHRRWARGNAWAKA